MDEFPGKNLSVLETKVSMKVFQMSDIDWWVGESKESIVEAYIELVGKESWERYVEDGYPIELTQDELNKKTIIDVDIYSYQGDLKDVPRITYQEGVNRLIEEKTKFPVMLYCSEW
ncbi:MAG: hypothetical protein ACYTKD_32365 [Planctomycetota bacterium]|jgi:hypothetical protein